VTPTVTPTPGPITITITPGQRALTCGATTGVTVNVLRSGAAISDGTPVQLQVNQGFLLPGITTVATVNTLAGNAQFTYNSPTGGTGVATLTATAAGSSQTTQITLFCGLTPPQPVTINQPQITCGGASANAIFSWTPIPGAQTQYLDLTLQNNGFAPGTFIGAGPLDPNLASIAWNGLVAGQTHYWRVNILTGTGWSTSQTGSFTPCAAPIVPGQVTYVCSGGKANVTFGLGTLPAGSFVNWLDISIFDNGFQPTTFIGSNVTGMQSYTWSGILPNIATFWRVNTQTAAGWSQTLSGSFTATC
jgi:hypothetical protein